MHSGHQFNPLAKAGKEGIKENAGSLYLKSDVGVKRKAIDYIQFSLVFFVVYDSLKL
jgi:hypothetical protein